MHVGKTHLPHEEDMMDNFADIDSVFEFDTMDEKVNNIFQWMKYVLDFPYKNEIFYWKCCFDKKLCI